MDSPPDIRPQVQNLTSDDPETRAAARMALLALDEDAVDPLTAEFYMGVSEALGVAILELVGEIGGPDALLLLRNVYGYPEERPAWHRAAGRGLLRNVENLSDAERELLRLDSFDDPE